ncbi:MAG: hypothetical protein II836_00005, partial [Clostridia bacterium]|nr:hypothetical protein [Clostridia bacterium]
MKPASASSFTNFEIAYLKRYAFSFACALTLAGMNRPSRLFFVLPDGTQEASAASLLGITAAQGA